VDKELILMHEHARALRRPLLARKNR